MLYDRIAGLELTIESCRLEPLELATSGGWTRLSTVVRFEGAGETGAGEDVCYQPADQERFRALGGDRIPTGRFSLAGFSRALDAVDLFPEPAEERTAPLYRRWACESAALDLALRQNRIDLGSALGREPAPVRYCVSMGLGTPPSTARIESILERDPGARFKVDLSDGWTEQTVETLAAFGVVDVVDLKGQYRGAYRGPTADPGRYLAVAEGLPGVWLEDPALEGDAGAVLEPFRDRITWDAILHSVADLEQLPFAPRCVNVKPSRFGFLEELLRFYEVCEARGIVMYGGGQFELGPGRGHIQYLASMFHPDSPNDVAPGSFNLEALPDPIPSGPLPVAATPTGFSWTS